MSRVGILGGTFNPPHAGHVALARAARDGLRLDRVVLMPVHAPPHKPLPDDPGPELRAQLCRAAVDGEPGLEVSTLELERGGASYTVATLETLHDQDPEDDLIFIVGGDMALTLPRWRSPERILELARLGIAERDTARRSEIEAALAPLRAAAAGRVEFFDMPAVPVSSSQVRRRVAAGEPVEGLVPPAVAQRIAAAGLYRTTAGARA